MITNKRNPRTIKPEGILTRALVLYVFNSRTDTAPTTIKRMANKAKMMLETTVILWKTVKHLLLELKLSVSKSSS